jgi:hypothetical protein
MTREYVVVDLDNEEKQAILKYASSFVMDQITKGDLLNKRKKWIRFNRHALPDVIGELSYHFNRCKDNELFHFLDQLIDHMEGYEKSV